MKNVEDESLDERLARLKQKRDEILSRIKLIDSALLEDGVAIEYEEGGLVPTGGNSNKPPPATSFNPQSGIRINGKLSFRGLEKASEYFDRLDEDNDGLLGFGDFRALTSITQPYGVVHNPEYLDWNAWKIYMDDLGVKTDSAGKVNREGFNEYRKVIELEQPLAAELRILGLSYLPKLQSQWRVINAMIQDVYHHRQISGTNRDIGNMLDLDDVAYVLGNADIIFTRREFILNMLNRAPFELVMGELLRKSFRRYFAHSNEVFAHLMTDNDTVASQHSSSHAEAPKVRVKSIKYIAPSQLVSWLFGRSPAPACTGTYRQLISLKHALYQAWRKIDSWTKMLFDLGVHLRLRMVFKDFLPPPKVVTKDQKSFVQVSANLGPQDNSIEDGVSLAWSLTKLASSEEFLRRLKLPKDCGLAFAVDLLLRSETTPAEAKKTADAIAIYLRSHFDDELKKNVQYRGILVFPAENEGDGASVIRVAVNFKRLVSIDCFLDNIFIYHKLCDLVTDFAGDFRTSMSLSDLFLNPTLSLDAAFTAKATCRVTYVRGAVQSIVRRAVLAFTAAISRNEIVTSDDPEEVRELAIWARLRPYFPVAVEWGKSILSKIRGVSTATMSFKYKSLSEFIGAFRLRNLWIKKLFPRSVTPSDLGHHLAGLFEAWRLKFTADLKEQYTSLTAFMEGRVAAEEAERIRLLMMSQQEYKSGAAKAAMEAAQNRANQEDLMSKLGSLGIKAGAAEFVDEESTDLKPVLDEMNEIELERDVQGYITYERVVRACLGVHAVEVVCGKSRLVVSCQGLDVFDMLPQPASLQAVKDVCDSKRRKKYMPGATK